MFLQILIHQEIASNDNRILGGVDEMNPSRWNDCRESFLDLHSLPFIEKRLPDPDVVVLRSCLIAFVDLEISSGGRSDVEDFSTLKDLRIGSFEFLYLRALSRYQKTFNYKNVPLDLLYLTIQKC